MKSIFIPPMISEVVYNALTGVDGALFDAFPSCQCGGKIQSHDTIKRRFSRVIADGTIKDVQVQVRRFICKECGLLISSPAPFYINTRFGAPIIDLCLTLAKNHPYYQTARILEQMGIIVDRGTVRNIVLHHNHTVEIGLIIGIFIPVSIINLSTLITSCEPKDPPSGAEIMKALGFYPSERE
ncbi:MAG: hypothetical protein JXA44_05265 [Methanospirillaceae archaeon]|nr:hypothetical protein [Methanospirillaceae archaeon]